MSFEPLGYGNRWYDRVIGGRLKFRELLGVMVTVGAIVAWFSL